MAAISDRDLRRVVAASMIGATIEWYDFFLYGTVAGIVFNKLFFPVQDPVISILLAYTTFAIGFVLLQVSVRYGLSVTDFRELLYYISSATVSPAR